MKRAVAQVTGALRHFAPMRTHAALLLIAALAPFADAQAENKNPVNWTMSIDCGPSVNFAITTKGYPTCQAAWTAGYQMYLKMCSPTAQVCTTNSCNDPAFERYVDWELGFNEFAGSCYTAVRGKAICDDNVSPEFDPVTHKNVCPPVQFSRAKNSGLAGPYCATGKCIANPVNPSIKNKFQIEIDYVGFGPFPLKFVRFYNSVNPDADTNGGLSFKWTHNYHRRLRYDGSGAVAIVAAVRGDGKVIAFNQVGGVYAGDANFDEKLTRTANGWTLVNTDDETEAYDDSGRLLSITNRAGLSQALAYDAIGRLASVADPFGRALTFTYDGANRIQTMTAPDGSVYSYSFTTDLLKNLRQVTYPDSTTRIYSYVLYNPSDSFANALSGITDENGVQFASYAYDGLGQPISTEHAGGAGKTTFQYGFFHASLTGTATQYVSPTSSAARTYFYSSVLGVAANTEIQGPPCPSCGPRLTGLDARGNRASTIDWNDNLTSYAYESSRNLETSRTEGLTAVGAATAQTRTITTEWHAFYRMPTRIAEPLRITTYTYGDPGDTNPGNRGSLLAKSIQATTDASGALGLAATPIGTPRTWSYTYNANGQVLTMDGPRTDVADVTTYTYYANDDADFGKRGNVATIANALDQVTSVTAYNAHGQPLTIVDANGLITTLTYDLRQRLTSKTVGGELTTYTYDNAGQLIKVTLPDNSFLSYSYDTAHRLTGIQDSLGNRIAYTLDLADNRTQEQVFDPANTLAQTRSRVYSNINRLFQELGAAGQTTEYGYDNQGNVTSVKDPLNHITSNQYDPLNRLQQVTDPNSGVTRYGYNGLDALTQVTDPRNLVTGYAVDGLGNLNQQASPDTGATVNTYDAAGNLLTRADAKGQTTAYIYDQLNRVSSIILSDGSMQLYAYDEGANGIGRLSAITEQDLQQQPTSHISWGYDPHGRMTSDTRSLNGVSYAVAYSYDASGRLSGVIYPSGLAVSYGFDALGRISQVLSTQGGQSQVVVDDVQYQPFGGVRSYTAGNGRVYARTYDQDGRIAAYTLGGTAYNIGFDAASRLTSIVESGNAANANTYGYDPLDRITQAVLPNTLFGYSYDGVGNRLTKTTGANTDNYAYGASSNRIASLTPAAGPARSFQFDNNGSTLSDGLNQYAYDDRGRLVSASNASGTTSYQVNALGQRVRKSNAAGDRVYLYDGAGRLIAEGTAQGHVEREYLYLNDIPIAVVQ